MVNAACTCLLRFGYIPLTCQHAVEEAEYRLVVLGAPCSHELSHQDVVLIRSSEQVPVEELDLHVPCVEHDVSGAFGEDVPLVLLETFHACGVGHASDQHEVGDLRPANQFTVCQWVLIDILGIRTIEIQIPSFLRADLSGGDLQGLGIGTLDGYVHNLHSNHLYWMYHPIWVFQTTRWSSNGYNRAQVNINKD